MNMNVIPILYYNDLTEEEIDARCKRFSFEDEEAYKIAEAIIERIREGGKEALLKITGELDHYIPEPLVITKEQFSISESIDNEVKEAFLKAAHNIQFFHEFQKKNLKNEKISNGDLTLGYIYKPVKCAAVYVPGGKANYPSSVLMGVIPAKVAGVEYVYVITPAGKNGEIHPSVLYCAKIAGADAILRVGGAHGIAASFFGIDVPPAEIIIGPGNRYVTAAKNILAATGKVKIDQPAGPSEILIIADNSANPKFVAMDMLAQAEHGEDSISVLITDSLVLAEEVVKEIENALVERDDRRRIKEESMKNSFILVFDSFVKSVEGTNRKEPSEDFYKAFSFINRFAPEHLEICLSVFDESEQYLDYIQSAGSVFIGKYAPVALGDYYSGTNHILPTGGSARIYSGVGVETFLKRITWQNTTKHGLAEAYKYIDAMSRIEGLRDHGYSVKVRIENGKKGS